MVILDSSMGIWREMILFEMRGWEGLRVGRMEERSFVWLYFFYFLVCGFGV